MGQLHYHTRSAHNEANSLFFYDDAMTQPAQLTLPPLSLYVHIPWCVRKCPYCDFNSHGVRGELPVDAYIDALLADCSVDRHFAQQRPIHSVFFGGGTPSLLPGKAIARLLDGLRERLDFTHDCEITLETNPGTAEYSNFADYRAAGVNRISLGAQSFNALQLQQLGRIHQPENIQNAFTQARNAGFDNINLDLMFALQGQSCADAMRDLEAAIALEPEHISWYQLTIEPNTAFYSNPPNLPDDDTSWEIQQAGIQRLTAAGYAQYEVSAYARPGKQAAHNINYWEFGDYMAIGAGAHGKITWPDESRIERYQKTRLPDHYLAAAQPCAFTSHRETLAAHNLPFEFMMNALRLNQGVASQLFTARTGLTLASLEPQLTVLREKGLLGTDPQRLCATAMGHQYLNSLLESLLPD